MVHVMNDVGIAGLFRDRGGNAREMCRMRVMMLFVAAMLRMGSVNDDRVMMHLIFLF